MSDAQPINDSWHSYPKIYALGHRELQPLLLDPVIVEEKVDGSQFSFGIFGGELRARSKGQQLVLDAPEKMFQRAVDVVRELGPNLRDGYTYRGEYLQKPCHNSLAYDRHPEKHIIVFDVNPGQEQYLSAAEKRAECDRIGLEMVPTIFEGMLSDAGTLIGMLDRVSCLGGAKIEGLVVKNYARFGADKKALMGKFVSEAFKEIHQGKWRENNPTNKDVIQSLIASYRTPARWEKALQHLKEAGKIEGSPRDIAGLIREVPADVFAECEAEITETLVKWAGPHIKRGLVAGLAEWYKKKLLGDQFGVDSSDQPKEDPAL